jgi:hypothetical protein
MGDVKVQRIRQREHLFEAGHKVDNPYYALYGTPSQLRLGHWSSVPEALSDVSFIHSLWLDDPHLTHPLRP